MNDLDLHPFACTHNNKQKIQGRISYKFKISKDQDVS